MGENSFLMMTGSQNFEFSGMKIVWTGNKTESWLSQTPGYDVSKNSDDLVSLSPSLKLTPYSSGTTETESVHCSYSTLRAHFYDSGMLVILS